MSELIDYGTIQCPNCGSFAWFYDDTVLCTDENNLIVDVDALHCEDCDHVWPVSPATILPIDDDPDLMDTDE